MWGLRHIVQNLHFMLDQYSSQGQFCTGRVSFALGLLHSLFCTDPPSLPWRPGPGPGVPLAVQCSCYTHSWQEIFTENGDDGGGDNDNGGDYCDCDENDDDDFQLYSVHTQQWRAWWANRAPILGLLATSPPPPSPSSSSSSSPSPSPSSSS